MILVSLQPRLQVFIAILAITYHGSNAAVGSGVHSGFADGREVFGGLGGLGHYQAVSKQAMFEANSE